MKMKRFVTVTIVILTLIVASFIPSTSSAAPDLNKYEWPPIYNSGDKGQQLLGYNFSLVDDFTQGNTGEGDSYIRTTLGLQRLCKDFNDALCLKDIEAGGNWWTNQVIPPCASSGELINCIEGVNYIDSTGNKEQLVLDKLIPGNTWPTVLSKKIEGGSSASRWISPKDKNSKKGFKVTVGGDMGVPAGTRSPVNNASLSTFQASVEPYEVVNGNYLPSKVYEAPDGFRSFGSSAPRYCIWADTNECGVQTEFSEGSKIELVLHVSSEISGWLNGRLDRPTFDSKYLGNSKITGKPLNRVTISGFPVNVPLFSTKVDLANATPELNKNYQENTFCKENSGYCVGYFGGNKVSSYFDYSYEQFQLFEKYFNDTANIVFPRWSIRSIFSTDGKYERCRSTDLSAINGIVTTNSSIYQGSPPTFDGESFKFKVAGLHNLPNKEEFKGTYDLVLKSEFARCLYGFSNAPVRAIVEVTNSDGTQNVVTNTFTEKNGWIYLSIKGFTFSQPTIKLKLSQDKTSTMPSRTTSSVRKTTITCVKGKTSKKVTAIVPKCPAGYKKK